MAIRYLFSLLAGLALLLCPLLGSGQPSTIAQSRAACVLDWSGKQLNVREATGHNDGPVIEAWLRATGNRKGASWCGAYQAAGQRACGLPSPKGAAGSYNWFTDKSRCYYYLSKRGSIDSLKPGHQVGFYYASLGRIGHIGRAVAPARAIRRGRPARGWYVNAGNTGSGGGRDGGGVRVVFYPSSEISAAANWLY
jgi:hypothetical protein